jgi:formate dehydrogenase alpha subunit
MADNENVKLEINGRQVGAPAGVTVLRAAEINGIYIPNLCSHKDLSPFGGCRLCLVEIEGIRGYPLACSTTVEYGMRVLVDTEAVQEMRREVLRLILSEHPSSCLLCAEAEECKNFMGTVRKAGVTSGCRYCPNDRQCELQDVVEKIGVTEIGYPILYKNLEAEREDPFFDRDYNICILCGRCVRMCQEIRGTAVLAFNWRGPKTTIGPAFGKCHIEAGCEFCGACVSVCPTGALAEKASKWDGKPDGSVISTCPYCAIGCQLELWHKDGRFSKALPALDPEVNDGQACLKGRFCLGEVSHHFDRARKPFSKKGAYWKEITWDEAIDKAAAMLKGLKPGEFALLVSTDCNNESLYAAQKFTRVAMSTNAVDSPARRALGGDLGLWTRLFRRPIAIQDIKKASRILAVGLDTRFNFSIIGAEIRKALQRGAELVTIDARESNLARYAKVWLQPQAGKESRLLYALTVGMKGDKKGLNAAAEKCGIGPETLTGALELLENPEKLVVVFGPAVFGYSETEDLVNALNALQGIEGADVIPLYTGANTRGAIEMGAFGELLPGAVWRGDKEAQKNLEKTYGVKLPADEGITVDDLLSGARRPKVLYLIGANPFFTRPDCDFLIVQDIFEPDFEIDLFLPAASFLETGGTLVNVEGRAQEAPRVETLPDSVRYGRARPDWWILSRIAGKLGVKGFQYESEEEVQKEIAGAVGGFPMPGQFDRSRRTLSGSDGLPASKPAKPAAAAKGRFTLVVQPAGYIHRGTDITTKVEGLQIINPEEGFHINPDDAAALGVTEGESIIVKTVSASAAAPARLHPEIQKGRVYLFVPEATGGLSGRSGLEALFRLKTNPCSVEVKKNAV